MNRKLELNINEFESLKGTDAMTVFVTNKFVVNTTEMEMIRQYATHPFHVRGEDYPNHGKNYVVYLSHNQDVINFINMFIEVTPDTPVAPNIHSINSNIEAPDPSKDPNF